MTDYTPIKDFAVKDNLAATDPERLIRGEEIQNELNSIASSIATKLDTDAVITPPDPVQFGNQHFRVPDIAGSEQSVNGSTLNFTVSDASWIFPIDVVSPSTSSVWFKLAYTAKFRLRQFSPAACRANFEVNVYLVNNDSENIFLIQGNRKAEVLNKLDGFFSSDDQYTLPIIANHITTTSVEELAGGSNNGYSVAIELKGSVHASSNNTTTATFLDPIIIYQELPNE